VLLAALNANAAEPQSCRTSLAEPLSADSFQPLTPLSNPDTIQFETGSFEATLGDPAGAILSDGVLLRRGDKLAGADRARYDALQKALHLEGGVRYEDPKAQILSRSAEFSYISGRIRFDGAEFTLDGGKSRGAAETIEINRGGIVSLDSVEYTTCPPGSEDWLMQGKSIKLDTTKGVGTAKGMNLKFKGVPILYAPYLSFPIGDARKTGVLIPEIGASGRSGNEISLPWYWNIAPNYDATFTPRLLTNRGLQIATKFRYLSKSSEGTIIADYLPSDDIINRARHQLQFRHRTQFGNGWRNQIDIREVSDNQYYEDLGSSLSISSITHLNQSLRFDYYSTNFSVAAQLQTHQTIDAAILPDQAPYQRLPQIIANGSWTVPLGLRFGIGGEVVYFDRDIGVTGWRMNAAPKLDLPISKPGWFIDPAVELDYTRYSLENTLPGELTDPDRSVPIASLDTGLILERTTSNSNRIQTIEPRLLYVHIPQRNQDDLPVFDTITPDSNLVQLYRKNRYLGVDRIGDTDHVSFGITSRILDVSSGRELVSVSIGQTHYLSDRSVTLPGSTLSTSQSSDYIAELRFGLFKNVNFDLGQQWGSDTNGTTRSEARLQYRPANNKILNLSYRYRRNALEQGDVSWSWPIARSWNIVGRYNFSLRDDKVLEQFFGLEYESCCWGLRLVSRRFISTRDGARDSSFGLQLVLKGMMSVGTAADKLLERGILGYSADLR